MIRLFERLTHLLAWVAGLTVLMMMFHVMIDVIGKYVSAHRFPAPPRSSPTIT